MDSAAIRVTCWQWSRLEFQLLSAGTEAGSDCSKHIMYVCLHIEDIIDCVVIRVQDPE